MTVCEINYMYIGYFFIDTFLHHMTWCTIMLHVMTLHVHFKWNKKDLHFYQELVAQVVVVLPMGHSTDLKKLEVKVGLQAVALQVVEVAAICIFR